MIEKSNKKTDMELTHVSWDNSWVRNKAMEARFQINILLTSWVLRNNHYSYL